MLRRASAQGALSGSAAQAPNGDCTAIKLPPTASFSLTQLAALGHAASPGRTRLNADVVAPLAANRARGWDCRAMIAAIPLSMFRLRIPHLHVPGVVLYYGRLSSTGLRLSGFAEPENSSRRPRPREGRGDDARWIGDVWRWLGMSGEVLGTSGIARRTLLYCYAVAVVAVGAVNTINVMTVRHENPQYGLAAPIVWEGSSWITFILFLWIAW